MFLLTVTYAQFCYKGSENFSRERLDNAHVTRGGPTSASVVCVSVTPAKPKEASRSC
jgi:hypothetical protein